MNELRQDTIDTKTVPGDALRAAGLLTCDYANDGERITQPGKFEGEPVFAPYYWEMGLSGFADSDDGRVYGFRFKAGDSDFVTWPQLKKWLGRKRTLKLVEDSQGFVHCY